MRKLSLFLALSGALSIAQAAPASAAIETQEARLTAASAAELARQDALDAFGDKVVKPGQYLWRDVPAEGDPRVIVSLFDQRAYLYRGDTLLAVAAISTGTEEHPTPTGIFTVLEKKEMHRSRKYDDAPMPFMQRIDQYGIALHAGHNPGQPASHGCIRLPREFAARLYSVTGIGTPVLIGV